MISIKQTFDNLILTIGYKSIFTYVFSFQMCTLIIFLEASLIDLQGKYFSKYAYLSTCRVNMLCDI